jgi:xanthine dehydrogenase accessory factor
MNRNDWITHAARLEAQDRAFALVTVLRAQAPTSAKAGDKALVTADGQIHGWIGGGCAQPAVLKTVRAALDDGIPRSIRIAPTDETMERTLDDVLEFGMACHSGGTLELFVDPVLPAVLLTVIGDSPVARALTGLATRLGLRVALVAEQAHASDYPEASIVLSTDDAAQVQAKLATSSLVVVATQGRRDLQGLKAALALKPQTLWFVASARKASVLRTSLIAAGEDPSRVAAIVAPAGQAIGAHTPEEIALSVLSAVVAVRRGHAAQRVTFEEQVVKPTPETTSGTKIAAKLDLPPLVLGSCCGGAGAAEAVTVAPVLASNISIKKSCCGD